MTQKYPSQVADRFLVRLPDGMRERIAEAARKNQRTMTREIALRLQASFEEGPPVLPFSVQQAVDDLVEETGCTPAEALERLVLAGQSQGGTVLNVRVSPGTTIAEVRAFFNEAYKHVPPDTNLILERE